MDKYKCLRNFCNKYKNDTSVEKVIDVFKVDNKYFTINSNQLNGNEDNIQLYNMYCDYINGKNNYFHPLFINIKIYLSIKYDNFDYNSLSDDEKQDYEEYKKTGFLDIIEFCITNITSIKKSKH